MAEEPRDHRQRHAVHHRVAGVRVTEIVQAAVLDTCLPTNPVPEPEISAARPGPHSPPAAGWSSPSTVKRTYRLTRALLGKQTADLLKFPSSRFPYP